MNANFGICKSCYCFNGFILYNIIMTTCPPFLSLCAVCVLVRAHMCTRVLYVVCNLLFINVTN